MLCSGPRITALRLANWSKDTSLIGTFLLHYHGSLRALSLRGTPASTALSTPLRSISLTLEPSLALIPVLMNWLTDPNDSSRLRVPEFTRQPKPAVLAGLLAAHSSTLMVLALPMLTVADAAVVAAYGCPR